MASPTVVIQAAPSRRPTTTAGTTTTDSAGPSSKVNEANATGPDPATVTRSSMSKDATSSRHHAAASAKRLGPGS